MKAYRFIQIEVVVQALGIFAEGIFAEGIFAEGIFAERNFRRK